MTVPRPKIAIVGGGIGGLFMGLCLERAEIPYTIYERAKEIMPLGSALHLSVSLAPLFIQLGLYDELLSLSKNPGSSFHRRENLDVAWSAHAKKVTQRFGYPGMILARYDLYRVLLSKIPEHKLVLGKRVLSLKQSVENGATLMFSDGTSAQCDLIVGADGAYSAVRKAIYQDLKESGLLRASDSEPMEVTSSCLVGTTLPIDPTLHPQLMESSSNLEAVMGDTSPYLWAFFSMHENRLAFMVLKNIKGKEGQDEAFRASEWSSKTAVDFANDVRHLKIPSTGKLKTLGDLFDLTDPSTMSKVMLEQKLFKTWHHGRVVLIGDAAHKMTPHAGLGALSAMFDAASLSGFLNDLEDNTTEGYTKAFEGYRNDRYESAKEAVNTSRTAEKLTSSKGLMIKLVQNLLFNWMPEFLAIKAENAMYCRKPQVTFLPFVPHQGTVENPLKQTQSKRMAPKSNWATLPVPL